MNINEVAAAAGVSVRTLRHYIQRELVDRPSGTTRNAKYFQKHVSQAVAARKKIAGGQTINEIALQRIRGLGQSSEKVVQGKRKYVPDPPTRVTRQPISPSVSIFIEGTAKRWEWEMVQEMHRTARGYLEEHT